MNLLRPTWGLAALLLLCWLWPAGSAHAASVQCTVGASQMDFGEVDPHSVTANHDVRTSATVEYSCENKSNVATDYSLCVGVNDGGGGYDPRSMGTQGGQLAFQIYQSPAYAVVLGTINGDGGLPYLVSGSIGPKATVSGTLSISGRLIPGQTVTAGNYARNMQGKLVVNLSPSGTTADCISGNQSQNFPLQAVAHVTNACYVDAGPMVDFGTHAAADLAQPLAGSTSITVTCSGLLGQFKIGLDAGQHAVGGTRNMQGMSSGDLIGYRLCQDPQCAIPWGNGTDTLDDWYFLWLPRTYTVYARTLATQTAPAGDTYTDTVTVFLYY
jgi:spore coat protein U-like protein